jgi:hypothetical protein
VLPRVSLAKFQVGLRSFLFSSVRVLQVVCVPGSRSFVEAFWNGCCAVVVATGLTSVVNQSGR